MCCYSLKLYGTAGYGRSVDQAHSLALLPALEPVAVLVRVAAAEGELLADTGCGIIKPVYQRGAATGPGQGLKTVRGHLGGQPGLLGTSLNDHNIVIVPGHRQSEASLALPGVVSGNHGSVTASFLIVIVANFNDLKVVFLQGSEDSFLVISERKSEPGLAGSGVIKRDGGQSPALLVISDLHHDNIILGKREAGSGHETKVPVSGNIGDESPGGGVRLVSRLDNDYIVIASSGVREPDTGHIKGGVVQGDLGDEDAALPGLLSLDQDKVSLSSCALRSGQA